MVSWGGLGGLAPLRNLRYPCLAPRGGLGGLAPQESPLITRALPPQRPCLAPVPCPQFFFVRIFSSEFFRPNFFVRIFSSEFFRPNFFRPIFSSVRRPSVRRPSVRKSLPPMLNCKNDCFYRGVKFLEPNGRYTSFINGVLPLRYCQSYKRSKGVDIPTPRAEAITSIFSRTP